MSYLSSSKSAESLFNANTEQLQETFHPERRPIVSQEQQADDEPSTQRLPNLMLYEPIGVDERYLFLVHHRLRTLCIMAKVMRSWGLSRTSINSHCLCETCFIRIGNSAPFSGNTTALGLIYGRNGSDSVICNIGLMIGSTFIRGLKTMEVCIGHRGINAHYQRQSRVGDSCLAMQWGQIREKSTNASLNTRLSSNSRSDACNKSFRLSITVWK